MTLWLILGAMTLASVLVLLRPLLRGPAAAPPRSAYDLEIYRDQLDELKREAARGLVPPDEALAAEREIARRLLAAAEPPRAAMSGAASPGAAPGRTTRRWSAFAIAGLVPLAAFGLYLLVGAPGMPDIPLAERQDASDQAGMPGLDQVIARLQARLKQQPNNLDGWLLLARSRAALKRFTEAAEAYRKAATLSGERPDILAAYAEMTVMSQGGTVTGPARKLFESVIAKAPHDPRARFYLGLAKAQAGDGAGALEDWRALEAEAPADAPWLPALRKQIEQVVRDFKLDPGAPPLPPVRESAAGPDDAEIAEAQKLSPEARSAMIRAMVERLAARLEQSPDDLEGWRRLGRAYQVLGETAKAADALGHAARLAPKDPDVLVAYGEALAAGTAPGAPPSPEAAAVMRQVLTLDGARPEALWYAGLAEAAAGDKAAAARHWKRLLDQLRPGTAPFDQVEQRIRSLGEPR